MSQDNFNTMLAPRTASRPTASRQTSGSIPVPTIWKAYEPHTPQWFTQALQRYASEQATIKEVQAIAQRDAYFCFHCKGIHNLSDVSIGNDRTQTFRYCRACADGIRQSGTDVIVIQIIEEPDEEPESPALFDLPDNANRSKETIQLSAIQDFEETGVVVSLLGKLTFTLKNAHPVFKWGMFALIVAFAWAVISYGPDAWNSFRYGNPPMTETNAVVGHGDSVAHPSHFIATNFNGTIIVVEFMAGDTGRVRSYVVAHTSLKTAVPFMEFDGNVHANMYVHVGATIYVLLNDGTQFKSN